MFIHNGKSLDDSSRTLSLALFGTGVHDLKAAKFLLERFPNESSQNFEKGK